MAIYGYCRISSKSQLDGNSLEQQKEEIKRRYPTAIIIEELFTGKKIERPKFNELINDLNEGDILVVTKLDRFARSTQQGLDIINRLLAQGISVHVLNIGFMDNSPSSELIRTIFLAFAQFERAMIVERTQEGKEIARQRGDYREGRPRKFNPKKVAEALNYVEAGNSYKSAAEIFGISKTTLIRRMQERKAKEIQDENKSVT